jgi:small subunit ribosomal protein S16
VTVKIRLMRVGKAKQPSYRVVVADSRFARDGRIIERIGRYAPRMDPSLVEIDGDRALDWLRRGAQPTEQAQKLLAAAGVWARYESEKGGPVRTKLARRGVTPRSSPPPPKAKERPAAAPEQPATGAAGAEAVTAVEVGAEPGEGSPVAEAEAAGAAAAEDLAEGAPAQPPAEQSEESGGEDGEGTG